MPRAMLSRVSMSFLHPLAQHVYISIQAIRVALLIPL